MFQKLVITFSAVLVGIAFCVSGALGCPPEGSPQHEVTKLVGSEASDGDYAGYAGLSGNLAAFSGPHDDTGGAGTGTVYVFEHTTAGWVEVAQLTHTDAEDNDAISTVAIDGLTVLAGTAEHDSQRGAAYIFHRDADGPGNWGQVKKLTAPDGAPGDKFGLGVALIGDIAVIGASAHNGGGAVYIFERNQGGLDSWGLVKKLTPPDGQPGDGFGWAVAVSGDTIIVGALQDDDAGTDSGSAYVFDRDLGGANNWGLVRRLTASDASSNDGFGHTIALSGSTVAIGAPAAYNTHPGAAYVFERNLGGSNNWGERKKLTASDAVLDIADEFGRGIGLDGDSLVVSAARDNYPDDGAAYFFCRHHGGLDNWGEVSKITPSDLASDDYFGFSVGLSGQTAIIVSVLDDNEFGTDVGAAYVFELDNSECPGQSDCKLPILTDLIGHWRMDGDGVDSSNAGLDLDLVGNPAFGDGLMGSALSLVGDNGEYATRLVDDDLLDFNSSDFTIQVWVNVNSLGGEQVFIEKMAGAGTPPDTEGWTLTKLADNTIRFGAATTILNAPAISISEGLWNHVVVRRTATGRSIWFNGAQVASDSNIDPVLDTTFPLLIGKRNDQANQGGFALNGRLDEIAIWHRALSDDEIDLLFNNGDGMNIPETSDCPCTSHVDCADLDRDGVRDEACRWWSCEAGACAGTEIVFADMGGEFGTCHPDGASDANDRFHALNCFSDLATDGSVGYSCEESPPAAFNVDAGGQFGDCQPDGVCDGNDAFHALNAFAGATSCSCPLNGPSPSPQQDGPLFSAQSVGLVLRTKYDWIRPGGLVTVEVVLDGGLADLRGYQLHLGVVGGDQGRLDLVDIFVDDRPDQAFGGRADWQAVNVATAQMVAGLDGPGVAARAEAYLATFVYRPTPDARGRFLIQALHDEANAKHRTFIFPTPATGRISVEASTAAVITVRRGPLRQTSPPGW